MFSTFGGQLHYHYSPEDSCCIAYIRPSNESITIYKYRSSEVGVTLRYKDGSDELEYVFSFIQFLYGKNNDMDYVKVPSGFTIEKSCLHSLSDDTKERILGLSLMLEDKYNYSYIGENDNAISIDKSYVDVKEDVYFYSTHSLRRYELMIVGTSYIQVEKPIYSNRRYCIPKDIFNDRVNRYIHTFVNKSSSVKSARK